MWYILLFCFIYVDEFYEWEKETSSQIDEFEICDSVKEEKFTLFSS